MRVITKEDVSFWYFLFLNVHFTLWGQQASWSPGFALACPPFQGASPYSALCTQTTFRNYFKSKVLNPKIPLSDLSLLSGYSLSTFFADFQSVAKLYRFSVHYDSRAYSFCPFCLPSVFKFLFISSPTQITNLD